MPADGERLATLEEQVRGLREDLGEMRAEEVRTRTRLHNLEGFAQAYLDSQKVHRRDEERQYRRLANATALAGVALSLSLVALAIITLVIRG